jgi:GT2 family glycosyltransferase
MKEARKRMSLPEDAFIIASIATNKGSRKNLGNILMAFRKFLDEANAWDDAFMYLHCNVSRAIDNPMGYELKEIWTGLEVAERIKYVHPIYYEAFGFTEREMRDIYRAADWNILCSLGEGWGMPLMEGLACGLPAIYGNYSSMPEVVGPGGLPVEAIDKRPFELSSSFQWIPSTKQIQARMVEAYEDWKKGSRLRNRLSRQGRLYTRQNYPYEKIMPMWENYLVKDKMDLIEMPANKLCEEGEVDIIVISWDGIEMLKRCIDAIYEHTTRPFHLIVINDQSTDGTHEYMMELWESRNNITYVRPDIKAKGGSEVMNQGYKRCRNKWIVSMNNDISVTEGWIEEAMKVAQYPEVGIVGMKFLWPWDERIQHAGGTFVKAGHPCHVGEGEPKDRHSETREAAWVSGPCVLINKEVLDPGWDEDFNTFGGHEDVDLCLRSWEMGLKVMYCGSAVVFHNEGATVTKLPTFAEMFDRNRTVFYSKWRGNPLLAELAKL